MNILRTPKGRPTHRDGVSRSGLRRIEQIVRNGPRAIRRQFIAIDRSVSTNPDHHSITVQEGRTYDRSA